MLRLITERLLVTAGVESGMSVLDVGCGPGDVSMFIADLVGPTGRVIGIDSNPEVIEIARLRFSRCAGDNVEFLVHQLDTLNVTTTFDAVVCRYVLIHQTSAGDLSRCSPTQVCRHRRKRDSRHRVDDSRCECNLAEGDGYRRRDPTRGHVRPVRLAHFAEGIHVRARHRCGHTA
jgi:SAM-dependent methyltransferase